MAVILESSRRRGLCSRRIDGTRQLTHWEESFGMSGLRQWRDKFGCAGRGVVAAVREGSSFVVHLAAAVAVIVLSVLLNVSAVELAVLLICIAAVLAVETFNSALETLARAVTSEHNEHVGKSLDMAAGAVLLMSTGAAAAGLAILVPRLKALWPEP